MQLNIHGKGVDIGDSLREHIDYRLPQIVEKYFEKATEATVVIHKESYNFGVDIQVHAARDLSVRAHGENVDVYSAFDEALAHVSKRLRRNKRRLQSHHNDTGKEDFPTIAAQQYILKHDDDDGNNSADTLTIDEDGGPLIIAEMQEKIETFTVSEAVMRMDLSGQNALLFKNSKHGKLNMVYMRDDGNIGWVDPSIS